MAGLAAKIARSIARKPESAGDLLRAGDGGNKPVAAKSAKISRIFKWFTGDFTGEDEVSGVRQRTRRIGDHGAGEIAALLSQPYLVCVSVVVVVVGPGTVVSWDVVVVLRVSGVDAQAESDINAAVTRHEMRNVFIV